VKHQAFSLPLGARDHISDHNNRDNEAMEKVEEK